MSVLQKLAEALDLSLRDTVLFLLEHELFGPKQVSVWLLEHVGEEAHCSGS